ncbi:MAG: HAD-IC family P-type ATPase, partial [Acidimicrobiales bacterium]
MNPFALPRAIGGVLDRVSAGRHQRRSWVGDGRAHIEVRGVHQVGNQPVARDFEKALKAIKGVQWAQVNAVAGRVVVVFDPEDASVDDLLDVIDGVEEIHDLRAERFPRDRPEHPGDIEPIRRNAIALGADVVGLGIGVFGQLLRFTPFPSEVASAVALAESEPRVRRFLESRIGLPATDLGLGVTNALAQALSQGPLGLVVDMAHRVNVAGELQARRQVWERREPELNAVGHSPPALASSHEVRPVPLPSGPVERYSDRAAIASTAAFGATLVVTGSPRRAANIFAAGVPKAARLGREGFAAHFDRILAQRNMLVMDRDVVRRLDRIDTVVLDATVLATGRGEFGYSDTFGDSDPTDIVLRAGELFDPGRPDRLVRRAGWALGPLDALGGIDVTFPRGTRSRARELGAGRPGVLGLGRRGRLLGLVAVESEIDPLAIPLASLVRKHGHLLAVAGGRGIGARLGATRALPGRSRLRASVRALQNEGHGVLLVSGGDAHGGLRAADCGIGITVDGGVVPWGADILTAGGLADAYRVVDAIPLAHRVARRSARLALAGSAAGGVWAMMGPASTAGRRAALPVNAAALSAQVAGVASAMAAGRTRDPVPLARTPWHALETDAVLGALGTSTEGLDPGEAERRRPPHTAELPQAVKLARAVGAELANPLTPVLAVGAALSAAVGSVSDAALVAGVTGANALIGGVQRVRTEVSIANLMRVGTTVVTVRRAGSAITVDAQRVVPGDVLELESGDVVPADCRILEADSCETDESALTGEPYPVVKHAAPVPGASVADRSCMLYEGATVVNGTALAVVVAIGDETEVGRSLADAPAPPPSGVEARLQGLTAATIPATVVSGAAVAGLSLLRGRTMRTAVTSGVSLMVAAVPEGLPVLATVAQLAAARRLSTRGALVRNPRTIEALGRVEVLCFDKTGTLTAGRIALQRVSNGTDDEPVGSLGASTRDVLAASVRASPVANDDDVLPSATDRAVVDGAAVAGVGADDRLDGWLPLGELPFEPSRGFHAVVGEVPGGVVRMSVKGAPEAVLSRCATWRSPGGPVVMDRKTIRRLEAEVERLARQGLRVLAVAERTATARAEIEDDRVTGMELLGFVALADLVRPTAAVAVADLRRAGVQVVMITGDHPSTAKAIAVELDILNGGRVLTGPDLDSMADEELDGVVANVSVFARVTPTQKVRIV